MSNSVLMNIAQMQEAAKAGAFIELVYVPTLTRESINRKAQFSVADVANTISKVGSESVILSTDMGQVGFPPPPEGMASARRHTTRARPYDQRESSAAAGVVIPLTRLLGLDQADLHKMKARVEVAGDFEDLKKLHVILTELSGK